MEESSLITQLKVVIFGDSNCGKTSLLFAWTERTHNKMIKPTIGSAIKQQLVQKNGRDYCLSIWDTAGQENYRSTSTLYCRNASAAMIVCDISCRKTFDNMEEWIKILRENGDIPFIIVGNKVDLENRVVLSDELSHFASKHDTVSMETSALTGHYVDEAFNALATVAVKSCNNIPNKPTVIRSQEERIKSNCC